jgi:hypothetical protein
MTRCEQIPLFLPGEHNGTCRILGLSILARLHDSFPLAG